MSCSPSLMARRSVAYSEESIGRVSKWGTAQTSPASPLGRSGERPGLTPPGSVQPAPGPAPPGGGVLPTGGPWFVAGDPSRVAGWGALPAAPAVESALGSRRLLAIPGVEGTNKNNTSLSGLRLRQPRAL